MNKNSLLLNTVQRVLLEALIDQETSTMRHITSRDDKEIDSACYKMYDGWLDESMDKARQLRKELGLN